MLRRGFEDLGLTPYEARVLVALLRVGSATTLQLARVSGVPRTSTYQVLESLHSQGLAVAVPGEGPARWTSLDRDQILERLHSSLAATLEEQMQLHRSRAVQVEEMLKKSLPEAPAVDLPFAQVLHGTAQAKREYDKLLNEAETELMMFTRPPFAQFFGSPNPAVLSMLARGVRTRVLYQAEELEHPPSDPWLSELHAYHAAGVEGRLADSLPLKLVVVDRRMVLVGMTDSASPDARFPTSVLVTNLGFATVLAEAFERYWELAQPMGPALET